VLRYLWMAALCWVVLAGVARAEGGAADPAPPGAAPADAQAQPAAAGAAGDQKADLQVRALEEKVSDLKEKIFRTKARLLSLQEMVIGGDATTGAKAVLVHRNEMGSSFYLESVAYALDGAPIYSKADVDGDLEKREEFAVFDGRVTPGNHQVAVQLTYRGHGYGVFSYLEGYKFKVSNSVVFTAEPGKATTVKVVGYEKGGITAELKDRPAVRFDVDVQREGGGAEPAAGKGGQGAKDGAPK
jgi:hypothetical protein